MAYRNYGPNVAFVVDKNGHGDFTTIAAALTAAVSGQTIYINDGTYTENITAKAGIAITAALGDSEEPNVSIVGKISFSSAGTFTISNCKLTTNSDYFLEVTGSAASIVQLQNCFLNHLNNSGIHFTTSNASAVISCLNCLGDLATTGIAAFVSTSTGVLQYINCDITNSGSSTTASTASAGIVAIDYSIFAPVITTSSTNQFIANYTQFCFPALNTTALTIGGSGVNQCISCDINGGSSSAISIGSNLSLIVNCSVNSSNTNAITGAGTLNFSPITFTSSSSTINTSTQVRLAYGPSAYLPLGVTFDNTNLLQNYAVGTWTPTFVGTVAGTTTYTTQQGYYTRIGNEVTIYGTVSGSAATGTGDAILGGFPFTIKNQSNFNPIGPVLFVAAVGWNYPATTSYLVVQGTLNTITGKIRGNGSAVGGGYLQMANAAFTVQFNLTYQI